MKKIILSFVLLAQIIGCTDSSSTSPRKKNRITTTPPGVPQNPEAPPTTTTMPSTTTTLPATTTTVPEQTNEPVTTITVTTIQQIKEVIEMILSSKEKVIVRVVFSESLWSQNNFELLKKLSSIATVIGVVSPSYSLKVLEQIVQYLSVNNQIILNWELGSLKSSISNQELSRILVFFELLKSKNLKAALSLIYQNGCPRYIDDLDSVLALLDEKVKKGLRYVFVNRLGSTCDWDQDESEDVFAQLKTEFPNSQIGF